VQAFTVVLVLVAVAGLGWALSALARRALRRRGVPIDDRDAADATTRDDAGDREDLKARPRRQDEHPDAEGDQDTGQA